MDLKSSTRRGRWTACLVFAGLLLCFQQAQAQPTIVSTVPVSGATGVSTNTTIVFTFSEEMDPDATSAIFYDASPNFYTTTTAWSGGNKILTCTPVAPFPSNKMISWAVTGANTNGDSLGGLPFGSFTTGSGGGGGGGTGNGTNAITSFALEKIYFYHQTSTALPTLDPVAPYDFSAVTTLSSNRTATNVLLTLPTGSVSNLTQSPVQPESFFLFSIYTNMTTLETTYPSGTYSFNVKAVTSNQTVTVNFPSTLTQPGAPHVSNYAAAQAVDPTQPFTLTWDAFPGGTAADGINVIIGDSFTSTNLGTPGALNGTATSIVIPANTLQPNSNYDGSIGFYRAVVTSNGTSYVTTVLRATVTDFTLVTGNGSSGFGPLVLTNPVFALPNFSFNVLCSPGQTVTVEYRTNLSVGSWQTLFTTNSPGNRFHAIAPQAATNRLLFFRARNGP